MTATPGGIGQSGIFHWTNTGGGGSLVVGAFPAQDTLIMDPPTWFTAVPGTASIDARLLSDTTATFAAGLWRLPRTSVRGERAGDRPRERQRSRAAQRASPRSR